MWVWPALGFACGLIGVTTFGIFGVFAAPGGGLALFYFSRDDHSAVTLAATALGTALGIVAGLVPHATVFDTSQAAHFRLGP